MAGHADHIGMGNEVPPPVKLPAIFRSVRSGGDHGRDGKTVVLADFPEGGSTARPAAVVVR